MQDRESGEAAHEILRNVAAYRVLCQEVRSQTAWGLGFGAFMLLLWYFAFGQRQDYGTFSLIYLALAGLEFTVAFWNRIRPSAEGILLNGFVLIAFGIATILRQYLLMKGILPGRPTGFMALFGIYWIWQGVGHIRNYFQLIKIFTHRPTAEHLRWFEDLLREVRAADPDTDANALDLPSDPPIRAKLLGDTIIMLPGTTDHPYIAPRNEIFMTVEPGSQLDERPIGYLRIEGIDTIGPFVVDRINWNNYANWKAQGGEQVTDPFQTPTIAKARRVADDEYA
jgi:hypothetical protein